MRWSEVENPKSPSLTSPPRRNTFACFKRVPVLLDQAHHERVRALPEYRRLSVGHARVLRVDLLHGELFARLQARLEHPAELTPPQLPPEHQRLHNPLVTSSDRSHQIALLSFFAFPLLSRHRSHAPPPPQPTPVRISLRTRATHRLRSTETPPPTHMHCATACALLDALFSHRRQPHLPFPPERPGGRARQGAGARAVETDGGAGMSHSRGEVVLRALRLGVDRRSAEADPPRGRPRRVFTKRCSSCGLSLAHCE